MREAIVEGRIGEPLFAWGGGSFSTSPFTTPTHFAFSSATSPNRSWPASHGGMGREGLEDGAMGVIRFSSETLAQFHDGFATKFASTGFEVHGEAGSPIGRDCMTQAPKGDVLLRTAAGEEQLKLDQENLYARSIRLFQDAVQGRGARSATGEDGVKSLSLAISAAAAARTGAETPIDLTV